jgi:hypothetical protein
MDGSDLAARLNGGEKVQLTITTDTSTSSALPNLIVFLLCEQ